MTENYPVLNLLLLIVAAFLPFYLSRGYGVMQRYFDRRLEKLDAEVFVLEEQAAHIKQTASVERNTLEATIKAHEKMGANKLRTEIARLAGDRKKIEELIGSKLDKLFEGYSSLVGATVKPPTVRDIPFDPTPSPKQ